ncbi:MAG: IS4 family transposase [Pirellulaceae bacterium]
MRDCNQGWFQRQVTFLRRQFLQDADLPFTDVLSEKIVAQALTAINVYWMDRIYPPLVTLWVFLSRVLSADHSCRAAVARLIAHRIAHGQGPCSSDTGAYCQARKRLPEKFFSIVACETGRALEAGVDPKWLWKNRRVHMFDGSTVSMADTAANQRAYPQLYNQAPGVGFPIARIAAIISLSCGAILDLGISRYAGKGQGEVSLLRRLWSILQSGDVLLTDCGLSNWTELVLLQQRGVDCVTRLNKARRTADFRRGKRLGKEDHIVRWPKPCKPRTVDRKTYDALPDFLTVRELRVSVEQPGFRTKSIIVVTTLLDPQEFTRNDLAQLYRARWHQELDLRSIKVTLQMDILRCKSPELVHKEIWTHVLAYNLIRTVMAQAATKHGIEPRSISFKGTLQTLEAFQPLIDFQDQRGSCYRLNLYQRLLDAVVVHRVADRPDRFEPRKKKRRPKPYDRLMKSRDETKRDILNGFSEN